MNPLKFEIESHSILSKINIPKQNPFECQIKINYSLIIIIKNFVPFQTQNTISNYKFNSTENITNIIPMTKH